MWTRKELKEKAQITFRKNYWVSIVAALVIGVFTGASSSSAGRNASNSSSNNGDYNGLGGIAGIIALAAVLVTLIIVLVSLAIKIVIGNALIVGSERVFIGNEQEAEVPRFTTIVSIFSEGFWKNVALTMFLKDLFTALWTLLLIVPGIVKSYEYKMIPYLLAENPEMDYHEAFAKSKEMMDGNKMNAFVLDLSFIGWFFLAALTLGILGAFYVNPYYHQTQAELYLTLKKNNNYNQY